MGLITEGVFAIIVLGLTLGVLALVSFQQQEHRRPKRSPGDMYRPRKQPQASGSEPGV